MLAFLVWKLMGTSEVIAILLHSDDKFIKTSKYITVDSAQFLESGVAFPALILQRISRILSKQKS